MKLKDIHIHNVNSRPCIMFQPFFKSDSVQLEILKRMHNQHYTVSGTSFLYDVSCLSNALRDYEIKEIRGKSLVYKLRCSV